MPLPLDNPIVIPSTEQKEFDTAWIYSIVTVSPSTDSGRVRLEILPYSASRNEIAPNQYLEVVETDQLMKAMAEVPEVAAAFAAILNAVKPLRDWIAAQNEPVPPLEPTPEPAPVEQPIVEAPVVEETPVIEEPVTDQPV